MRYLVNGIWSSMPHTYKTKAKYIEFVLPSKENLFKGKLSRSVERDQELNDIYRLDIRLIINLLHKGDLRILDVMYGKLINEDTSPELKELHKYIQANREEILKDTRVFFLKNIIGQAKKLIKKLDKNINGEELADLQKLYWIYYMICRNESINYILTEINKNILFEIYNSNVPNMELYLNLKNKFEMNYNNNYIESKNDNILKLEKLMMDIIFSSV